MYPLSSRWTKSRGPLIVAVIWISALGLSSAQLVHGKAEKFTVGGQDIYDCSEVWDELDGKIYTVAVFTVTFVLPMVVLTFAYSCIGWKMWRHTSPGNADASRDQQQLLAKMKVVKMMATVVLLFAVCWLPIQIFSLLIYFNKDFIMPQTDAQFLSFTIAFFCCHWLSMANSFVNPIVYCFMSENFRVGKTSKQSSHIDLRQLLFCCCTQPQRHTSRELKGNRNRQSSFRTTTLVLSSSSVKNSHQSVNIHPMKVLQQNTAENGLMTVDD